MKTIAFFNTKGSSGCLGARAPHGRSTSSSRVCSFASIFCRRLNTSLANDPSIAATVTMRTWSGGGNPGIPADARPS